MKTMKILISIQDMKILIGLVALVHDAIFSKAISTFCFALHKSLLYIASFDILIMLHELRNYSSKISSFIL